MRRNAGMTFQLILGCFLFGIMGTVCARMETHPDFRILSVQLKENFLVYYLDIHSEIRLGRHLQRALKNGVPLKIVYRIQVLRKNKPWWMPGRVIASLSQGYRLQYLPLSRRYRVENLNIELATSFQSLPAALHFIDYVRNYPLSSESVLPSRKSWDLAMKVGVDTNDFPLPLRLRSIFDPSLHPSSPWFLYTQH